MTTETYRGVHLRVQKGQQWGYLRHTVNGHSEGDWMGRDEAKVFRSLRATVDAAIAEPERYQPHWQPGYREGKRS